MQLGCQFRYNLFTIVPEFSNQKLLQSFYLGILNSRFLESIFPLGTLRIRIPLWLKSNSEKVDSWNGQDYSSIPQKDTHIWFCFLLWLIFDVALRIIIKAYLIMKWCRLGKIEDSLLLVIRYYFCLRCALVEMNNKQNPKVRPVDIWALDPTWRSNRVLR